jgi:hypothetical protein
LTAVSLLKALSQRCAQFLRRSNHVHVRQDEVRSLRDAIQIVDKFVLGRPDYPLQWDDFISWAQPNPTIERMREELAALEAAYFSQIATARAQAIERTIEIRDRYAAMIGIAPLRDS